MGNRGFLTDDATKNHQHGTEYPHDRTMHFLGNNQRIGRHKDNDGHGCTAYQKYPLLSYSPVARLFILVFWCQDNILTIPPDLE